MQVHDLKCWPDQFQASWEGRKSAELRIDDRHYQSGDLLWLREWDPMGPVESDRYSGRTLLLRATHVQRATPPADGGMMEEYVSLSCELVRIVPLSGEQVRIENILTGAPIDKTAE